MLRLCGGRGKSPNSEFRGSQRWVKNGQVSLHIPSYPFISLFDPICIYLYIFVLFCIYLLQNVDLPVEKDGKSSSSIVQKDDRRQMAQRR